MGLREMGLRETEIIHNLINEIMTKTEFPPEQLDSWLKTEIGMTEEELAQLAQLKNLV